MTDATDILKKIQSDFGDKASEVIGIFDQAISKAKYLNDNRVIRCIIFLAEKNIKKLTEYIEAATSDPRDVMYWAEYINREPDEKIKQVRDFSKPFDEAYKTKNQERYIP